MKILINGICGRMGSELSALLRCGYHGHTLAGGADPAALPGSGILVSADSLFSPADVLIDFSHHTALDSVCSCAERLGIPAVIATTGHSAIDLELLRNTAHHVPVFHTPNFSIGIAVLCDLACTAAAFFPDADIEIVEAHHSHKLDAPSGTAIALAQQIAGTRPNAHITYGRNGHERRDPDDICIHALRMGEYAGAHTVYFACGDQTISLSHTTHTPRSYAQGALTAAEFLVKQPAGLYGMSHLMSYLRRIRRYPGEKSQHLPAIQDKGEIL